MKIQTAELQTMSDILFDIDRIKEQVSKTTDPLLTAYYHQRLTALENHFLRGFSEPITVLLQGTKVSPSLKSFHS